MNHHTMNTIWEYLEEQPLEPRALSQPTNSLDPKPIKHSSVPRRHKLVISLLGPTGQPESLSEVVLMLWLMGVLSTQIVIW